MATTQRGFKDDLYAQFSRIGKAISAPKRLELLELLCQGARTVEALAEQASLSLANASRHLQVLRGARLVETAKKGLYVEYRLADNEVSHFLCAVHSLAETRLAEVRQVVRSHFGEHEALEAVDRDELLRRVRKGEVTVVDVRPSAEYLAGHIPGALSIPLAELAKRVRELPRGREIVAYCRGPYCVMAMEAVALLRDKGFRAQRMEQGVAEWRARGWRIEGAPKDSRA